jgi:acylpyruvate hydrolase
VVNQETELGVVVGKTCRNVTEEEAKKAIGGYCLALDMTEVKHLVRKKINFVDHTNIQF